MEFFFFFKLQKSYFCTLKTKNSIMRAILWLQFEEKCSEKKTKKIPPYPPVLQTTKIIKYEIAGGIGGFFFFFYCA